MFYIVAENTMCSFFYLSLVSLRWVWQEAGIHILQVWTARADRGDAESVAAVPPSSLVRPVVRVVKGLGVRACGTAATGLRQLSAADDTVTGGLWK